MHADDEFGYGADEASNSLYRSTFENAAVGVANISRAGVWLRVNRRLCEIVGYTTEELRAKTYRDLTHPDDLAMNAHYARLLDAGQIDRYRVEKRYFRKDGSIVWVQVTVSWLDVGGRAGDQHIAIIEDITARKAAEAAVAERLAEIEALYQNAPVGLALFDRELRFLRINAALADMTGVAASDHIGRVVWDVLPDFREGAEPKLRHVLDTGEPVAVELSGETPKLPGVTRHWDERFYPLVSGGEVIAVGAAVVEITERKRYEERLRLVLREMNHRSKNTLSLVQAVARQTVATDPENFRQKFADRLQSLSAAQDLLIKSDWEGADVVELVRSQLGHFHDLIGQRISLEGPALNLSTSAAQTIAMTIHELATNAAKHGSLSNDVGCVAVTWGLATGEGPARFTMAWTESGGPVLRTPERRGFGTVVLENVAKNSLEADVKLDYRESGAAWLLECPAANVLEFDSRRRLGPATVAAPLVETSADVIRGRRILVVEDEAIAAMELADLLSAAGYSVVGPAANVASAQRLLLSYGCDAAVLDINLGRETSESLAELFTKVGKPFVTVSAYAKSQAPTVYHASPFLVKPLRSDLLLRVIEQALQSDDGEQASKPPAGM